uniref:NADH-ubiquinone oxidoreductase chain 3 n=1 Tax=Solen strictus TaxID=194331 RepID=H9M5U9_9BIVA|nr:NADH dehydrogenase subunit 3 [Solen strictus]AER38716.1 NADH dehydrogenase subunit 3 [Solen strictus]
MSYFCGGAMFSCFIFFLTAFLSFLGVVVSKRLSYKDREKMTSFECGFDPISNSRKSFSVRFFLLSIIFLIFDIELILVIPIIYSVSVSSVLSVGLCIMFLVVLLGGLFHEMNEGSLDWTPVKAGSISS